MLLTGRRLRYMGTFIIWAIVIIIFGGGVFLCGANLISGSEGEKARSVIAIVLGIITFFCVYSWFESIGWCLFFSGLVVGLVSLGDKGEPAKAKKPGPIGKFAEGYVEGYIQKEITKEAVKEAIRESKD